MWLIESITDPENPLTIERLTKYFVLSHQHLLHFRFELAILIRMGFQQIALKIYS
jgi:hypothetical protein